MSKIKVWLNELRAPFLTGTIIPIILGTVIAWVTNNTFNPLYFILALLGGVFVHLGANVVNDYFDYKSGTDTINKEFVRPFTGGTRTIPSGLLTPKEVFLGAIILFVLASLVGLYFTFAVGPLMLVFAAVGLFSAYFYTGPPFNLAGRGLGEPIVGLNFGVLMTLGAFFVQTGTVSIEPVIAALPVAFLITAILYINAFQDYAADKATGKHTWVVRLGREKASIAYAGMMYATYASIVIGVLLQITPIYTIIALTTLPITIKSVSNARRFHSSSLELVPSNALTIVIHLFTGILLIFGYVLAGLTVFSIGFLATLASAVVCIALAFMLFKKIAYGKRPP